MFAVTKFLSRAGRFSCRATRPAAVLSLAALLGGAVTPLLWADKPTPLVPPNATLRGKTFEQWNVLYTQWFVQTYLGEQTPSDTVKGVRFLPGNPAPGAHVFNVQLRPGTPFVLPPFPVFGELYDNNTQDDPNDPIIAFILETTDVYVELDGQVLMEGTAADLARYGYGPTYFEQPIYYAEPQPRGPNLNSVAALFALGVGAVYHPLPPGEHTLVTRAEGLLGDYNLTHHITVR